MEQPEGLKEPGDLALRVSGARCIPPEAVQPRVERRGSPDPYIIGIYVLKFPARGTRGG